MGIFITLQQEVSGAGPSSVDGKAIGRFLETLDLIAGEVGVVPLSEFISVAPEELADFDLDPEGAPPEQWFQATDGLRSVRALLPQVAARLGDEAQLLTDLRALERALDTAESAGVDFHLCVDL